LIDRPGRQQTRFVDDPKFGAGSDCLRCQAVTVDSKTTTAPPRVQAAEKG
jgi:hypothetical protein